MSDTPYVPFFTSDFLGGTGGMTAATKGVYITLLCLMYEAEEPLGQAWDILARRCGCTLPAFRKALSVLQDDQKITITDGRIWSHTCDKHLTQRRERRNSAMSAAKQRWQKNQQNQRTVNASAMQTQCQPEPEPEKEDKSSFIQEEFSDDDKAAGDRCVARRLDSQEGEVNVVALPKRLVDGSDSR